MLRSLPAAVACAALLVLVGCTGDDDPAEPQQTESAFPREERAAIQALAFAPADSTRVRVTDFFAIKQVWNVIELDSTKPAERQAQFWRRIDADSPVLTPGRLRVDEAALNERFGFNASDVLWEAEFNTDAGAGWALRLREGVALDRVQAAVDELPSLEGGVLDAASRVIAGGVSVESGEMLVDDDAVRDLIDSPALAVMWRSDCFAPDEVYPGASTSELEAADDLDDLGAFAVILGDARATALFGDLREDAFDRQEIHTKLPPTDPPFGDVFVAGVGDPNGGRIGYTMTDPVAAADLVNRKQLPFALC